MLGRTPERNTATVCDDPCYTHYYRRKAAFFQDGALEGCYGVTLLGLATKRETGGERLARAVHYI